MPLKVVDFENLVSLSWPRSKSWWTRVSGRNFKFYLLAEEFIIRKAVLAITFFEYSLVIGKLGFGTVGTRRFEFICWHPSIRGGGGFPIRCID